MRASLPKAILFVVLSLCDLALTWWLLERSGRAISEGNPVALWWLSRYGWLGLAGFKTAVVFVVVLSTGIIARQRPRAACHLLTFACAVLAAVVIHGAVLGQTAPTPCDLSAEVNRDLEDMNVQTQRLAADARVYNEFLENMVDRVAAGELTLAQAIERLMQWDKNRHPRWQQAVMSIFRSQSMEEALARQVLSFVKASGVASSVEYNLRLECEALFGGNEAHDRPGDGPGNVT